MADQSGAAETDCATDAPADNPAGDGTEGPRRGRRRSHAHPVARVALAVAVVAATVPIAHAVGAVGGGEVEAAQAAALLPEPDPVPVGPFPAPPGTHREKAWVTAAVAAHHAASEKLQPHTGAVSTKVPRRRDAGGGATVLAALSGAIPTTSATQKSGKIQALVREHFPADEVGNAMAVAACESGHSDAIGSRNSDGTTDWGVFQLNDGGTLQASLRAIGVPFGSTTEAQKAALRTEVNVRAAARIYADRGWAPWVCAYKIGVVSSLYGNAPGPMYGKFDKWGKPTVPMPVIDVGPAGAGDRSHPGRSADDEKDETADKTTGKGGRQPSSRPQGPAKTSGPETTEETAPARTPAATAPPSGGPASQLPESEPEPAAPPAEQSPPPESAAPAPAAPAPATSSVQQGASAPSAP